MESKKLEKPCENATFQALQGVMKPDEETGGVFPAMYNSLSVIAMETSTSRLAIWADQSTTEYNPD